jgi:hypothetical protein
MVHAVPGKTVIPAQPNTIAALSVPSVPVKHKLSEPAAENAISAPSRTVKFENSGFPTLTAAPHSP